MKDKAINQDTDMRPEYDFSKGERGKYAKRMRKGYVVEIRNPDGSVEVKRHEPEEGTVLLEPDVRKYFPDSDAVNAALRALIALIPKKKRSS